MSPVDQLESTARWSVIAPEDPVELERVADGAVREDLVDHGAQEVLLPVDPVEVALEQAVARPHVLQRQVALDVVSSPWSLLSCWLS